MAKADTFSQTDLDTLWAAWASNAPQDAQVGLDAGKDRGEAWACLPWPPMVDAMALGPHFLWRRYHILTKYGGLALPVLATLPIKHDDACATAKTVPPPQGYTTWANVMAGTRKR